eukprot:jgi/Mesvir1/856/Mv17427-RA.1
MCVSRPKGPGRDESLGISHSDLPLRIEDSGVASRNGGAASHNIDEASNLTHNAGNREGDAGTALGAACINPGPLNSASPQGLEALYLQARNAYYNGVPILLDDIFDFVEERLRQYKSELVRKYPRCSLRRYTVYSDAESDQDQLSSLKTIWTTLLGVGVASIAVPVVMVAQSAISWQEAGSDGHIWQQLLAFGALAGVPLILSAMKGLASIDKEKLVALKGTCPNCGEDVFAFVRLDDPSVTKPRHKMDCHVCDRPLVFQATLQESVKNPGHLFAYGRVYLVSRANDLAPEK